MTQTTDTIIDQIQMGSVDSGAYLDAVEFFDMAISAEVLPNLWLVSFFMARGNEVDEQTILAVMSDVINMARVVNPILCDELKAFREDFKSNL